MFDKDPLLTDPEAAQYLKVKDGTLANWRCTGRRKIPYIRLGRSVRYRRSDLDAYLQSCTVGGNDAE